MTETSSKPADAGSKTPPKWLVNGAAGFVAVASALTAIFSFTLTETGNRALRLKSQALDRKTVAVQHWNAHQAVRTKRNIAELAAALLTGEKAEAYRNRLERYRQEEKATRGRAEQEERQADTFDDRSEELLGPRQFQIVALILLQISVALGSISILAKSPKMLGLAGVSAAGGTVLALIGALAL